MVDAHDKGVVGMQTKEGIKLILKGAPFTGFRAKFAQCGSTCRTMASQFLLMLMGGVSMINKNVDRIIERVKLKTYIDFNYFMMKLKSSNNLRIMEGLNFIVLSFFLGYIVERAPFY